MKKALVFFLSILIFSIFGSFSFPKAYAAINFTLSPDPLCQDQEKYTLTFDGPENTFVLENDYTLMIWPPNTDPNDFSEALNLFSQKATDTKTYTSTDIGIIGEQTKLGLWHYKLWFGQANAYNKNSRDPKNLLSSGEYTMYPREACTIGLPILEMSSPVQIGSTVPIKVKNINPNSNYILWFVDGQDFVDGKFPTDSIVGETIEDTAGNEKSIKTASFLVTLDNVPGIKTLCLKHGKTNILGYGKKDCEISIPIEITIQPPQVAPKTIQSSQPGVSLQEATLFSELTDIPSVSPPCAKDKFINGKCTAVDTAIGPINTDPAEFVQKIFSIVLGLAGGIALILIIISGYKFMISGGNPEAVKAASEGLTSAIIGLLFIIFAFVILQIIGVDILQIPGFTK